MLCEDQKLEPSIDLKIILWQALIEKCLIRYWLLENKLLISISMYYFSQVNSNFFGDPVYYI